MARINSIENLITIPSATGDTKSWAYPAHSVDHSVFVNKPLHSYGERNKVPLTTFDFLFEEGIIKDIGFIHLDVEGMEFAALKGSVKLITVCQPIIAFEVHLSLDDVEGISKFLKELNLLTYLINEVTPGGRPDCVNFLALPSHEDIETSVALLNDVKPIQSYYNLQSGQILLEFYKDMLFIIRIRIGLWLSI